MNKNKAFTLIELIVVMVIIGILILLATPRFLNYIEMAKETRIAHDVKVAENMAIAHYVSTGEWPFDIDRPIEDEDLLEMVENGKAYTKQGLVNEDGSEKEESIVRSNVVYAENIKTTNNNILDHEYFILSKEYAKREVGSRLNGFFILSNEGNGVYLDKIRDAGEEEIDDQWKEDHIGDTFEDEKYKYTVIELIDETTQEKYFGVEVNGLSEEYKIKNRNEPGQYGRYHVNDIPLKKNYKGVNLEVIRIGDRAFEVLNNRIRDDNPRVYIISHGVYEDEPETLIIHRNIREIGRGAFSYNSSIAQDHVDSHVIKKLDLSKAINLKLIEEEAFLGLKDQNLKITSSIVRIEAEAFASKVRQVSGINYSIGSSELDLSEASNLRYIGKNAFTHRNIGLEETSGRIFIPENVIEIGDQAFDGNRIKDLDLSEAKSLKKIGSNAFASEDKYNHKNVIKDGKGPVMIVDREIFIPKSVRIISMRAFFPSISSTNTNQHVVKDGVQIVNLDFTKGEFDSRSLDGLKLIKDDYIGPGKYTWNETNNTWDYEAK